MSNFTFHLLPNAHLDPVWLWDWREGLNEGLITTRTMLDLMDADDGFTFIRGEAAIYQHIEQHDPETFARLRRRIREGRWDVVGGTYIQPDTNMPATECFARHFCLAQNYFLSRFGKRARVAWAADSFGHSAGLPEILAAAGMQGFGFGRPNFRELGLRKPAFWWVGPGGSRVLAYSTPVGWYGNERDEMPRKLDTYLTAADEWGLSHLGIYYGLGNHGGGSTRRMLADIRKWAAAHPEVRVVHSTLHRFFDALRRDVDRKGPGFIPVHRGELNFFARGCYASAAKLKFAYRRAEAAVSRAEQVDAAISAAAGKSAAPLRAAWEAVLFNSFHDILPGSSIERAYDDQLAWLGGALHQTQQTELAALNVLAANVDTRCREPKGDHPRPVSFLVFNPQPHEYRGPLELEASLDYRPIHPYDKRPEALPMEVRGPDGALLPFQPVPTEHSSFPHMPWRKRVVVPVTLPAMGWSMLTFGWVEGAQKVKAPSAVRAAAKGAITNGIYRVVAVPGAGGLQIFRRGKPVFTGTGLAAITVEDPWGSWGPMVEDGKGINLSTVRHRWKIDAVETLERGPERAALWIRMQGGNSRLELTVSVSRDREAVDISARLLWNERSARLKLIMPVDGKTAEYEVPGGSVTRGELGEVPGGRWVRVRGARGAFGFASDALYGFDLMKGVLRASVVRASRYANDVVTDPVAQPWLPAVDAGELRFRFVVTPGDARLPQLADELVQPLLALPVPPHKGAWPRSGSFLALSPASLRLLAFKPAENGVGWILRVQEVAGRAAPAELKWLGRRLKLGTVPGRTIATWRLIRVGNRWHARPCDMIEKLLRS